MGTGSFYNELIGSDWMGRSADDYTYEKKGNSLGWEETLISGEAFSSFILKVDTKKKHLDYPRQLLLAKQACGNIMNRMLVNQNKPTRITFTNDFNSYRQGDSVCVTLEPLKEDNTIKFPSFNHALDPILGYCAHEIAHVLYTDDDYGNYILRFRGKEMELKSMIMNILEDERIEKLVAENYRGYTHYLGKAKDYCFGKRFKEEMRKNGGKSDPHPVNRLCELFIHLIRYPKALREEHVNEFEKEVLQFQKILTPFPNSIHELTLCTEEIYKVFLAYFQQTKQPQQQPQKGDQQDQQEQEQNEQQSTAKADSGGGNTKSDKGEESEEEEDEKSKGSDGKSEKGKDKKDTEQEQGGDSGDESEEEKEEKSDEGDSGKGKGNEKSDDEDDADSEDKGKGKSGNKSDEDTDEEGDDADGSGSVDDGDEQDEDSDADDSGNQQGQQGGTPQTAEEMLDEMLEELGAIIGALASALPTGMTAEEVADAFFKGAYGVEEALKGISDFDNADMSMRKSDTHVYPSLRNLHTSEMNVCFLDAEKNLSTANHYDKALAEVKPFAVSLRAELQKMNRNVEITNTGLFDGNFDDGLLVDALIGRKNVYSETHKITNRGVCVVLLTDESGSMEYSNAWFHAQKIAVMFERALDGVNNTEFFCYGHTTGADSKAGVRDATMINCYFEGRKKGNRKTLGKMYHHNANRDGHAILEVVARVRSQIEKDKPIVMFMISDGEPSASVPHGFSQKGYTKKCVDTVEKTLGTSIIHVAIHKGIPSADMFNQFVTFSDFRTLVRDIGGLLKKIVTDIQNPISL